MTVQSFEEKVLRGALNMISADVVIEGKGTVLISSDGDETKDNLPKLLSVAFTFSNPFFVMVQLFFWFQDFGIQDGTRLQCDDFHQEYNLNITICHRLISQTVEQTFQRIDYLFTMAVGIAWMITRST